ncbi:MAG: hypothetical protein ACFUZC_16610 [Chthoniobacteraceae bacterium]
MAIPSKVKPGDPIRSSDWNMLLDEVKAGRITSVCGGRFKRGSSGTTLAIPKVRSGAGGGAADFPFRVVLGPSLASTDTSGTAVTYARIGVISDSHVIDGGDADTNEIDNTEWGLLGADRDEADVNWINVTYDELPIGAKLWLQFKFDSDGALVEVKPVTLEWGVPNSEDLWLYYPDPIEVNADEDPYQQYYRVLIAEVTDPEQDPRDGLRTAYPDGTAVQITQIQRTNLLLTPAKTAATATYPYLDIRVAIPWSAPGSATDGNGGAVVAYENIKLPWVIGRDPIDFPWQLRGRIDKDNQPRILVGYGEVNEVVPDGMEEGKYQEFEVSAAGVVYLAVSLSSEYEVVECWVSIATDNESIPADSDTEVHFIIGRFYMDDDNMPVPTQLLATNVNMGTLLTVDLDTFDLYRYYLHIYTQPRSTSENLFDLLYEKLLSALTLALQTLVTAAQTAAAAAQAALASAQAALASAQAAVTDAQNWAYYSENQATAAQNAVADALSAASDAWSAETDAWAAAAAAEASSTSSANSASSAESAATRAETAAAKAEAAASKSWVAEGVCNADGTVTVTISQV